MSVFQDVILESFGAFIAVITGFVLYSNIDRFHRLLFAQLLTWMLLYIASYVVVHWQRSEHLPLNNHWVFNLNVIVEAALLLTAAYLYFDSKQLRILIGALFASFGVIYLVAVSGKGFLAFSEVAFNTESFVVIVVYGAILLYAIYQGVKEGRLKPETWACLGLVLYFAGNIPFFTLFTYLNEHNRAMSEQLHRNIIDVLSNMRYLLLAGSFLMHRVSTSPVP